MTERGNPFEAMHEAEDAPRKRAVRQPSPFTQYEGAEPGALHRKAQYRTPPPVDITTIDFDPPTVYVPVHTLREGDVVMEAPGYPVVVVRLSGGSNVAPAASRRIYCRYVWQHPSEATWLLGTFHAHREVRKAI